MLTPVTDLNTDITHESPSSARVNWRKVPTLFAGFALLLGLLVVPAGAGSAASTPVPLPGVDLPDELDWAAEYHGTTICHPQPKPGTLRLGALLDRTYGEYTKYYAGTACPNGLQHQEGRAIDWMVNSARNVENAKAEAFIAWLLADGPNGESAANARRLGIMYLVWNNRIWAIYRQSDGWRNYQGCTSGSRQSSGNDTSCHRDHIHISLSWDGANAQTSFWTGKVENRKPCPSSFTSRPNGSSAKKLTLLNTHSGTGLAAGRCRLAGHTGYKQRSYQVKVPVPDVAPGTSVSQRIKITKFQNNAPGDLQIRSAQTVTVRHNAKLPAYVSVPLRSDGVISFSLPGGHARLKARAIGAGAEPPAVSASLNTYETWVNSQITAAGTVSSAPRGANVALQIKSGAEWLSRSRAKAVNGSYSLPTTSPGQAGTFTYRAAILKKGVVLASTSPVRVVVKPAEISLEKIKLNRAATKSKIRGRVRGAPSGSTVIVRRRAEGEKYKRIHTFTDPAENSDASVDVKPIARFKSWLAIEAPGKYRFKVKLLDGKSSVLVKSKRRTIRVG